MGGSHSVFSNFPLVSSSSHDQSDISINKKRKMGGFHSVFSNFPLVSSSSHDQSDIPILASSLSSSHGQCKKRKRISSSHDQSDFPILASSSSHDQFKYDVFLSFRGGDTRLNFTSHLYSALSRHKIQTFIDDNELERGEEISPALIKAIKESKVSVVIFSEDYASSKWCLEELVKIIECKKTNGQLVIPVFYRVVPSDVRKQSGSFKDAFDKHEQDFKENFAKHEQDFKENMEKMQRWRAALKEAADLAGWDSEVTKPESRLVDKIVTSVLKKLNHMSSSEFKGLVGIESRIERLNSILCIGSADGVRILGLWGMGGIGKTTIAGAFFYRFSSQFEASCFLANVREQSEKRGIDYLRELFLSKILEDKNLYTGTPHIGSTFIMNRLNRKKVLIVFDDVSHFSQLIDLVGGPNLRSFGSGSRIIVTSRDRQVLQNCELDHTEEVKGLEEGEDLQLFCLYAFKQKYCSTEYLELSSRVISYARGNPLALQVLGSSLFGKSDKRDWESKLEVLHKIGYRDIQQVLKTSYDELDDEKKDIFLYIACFFSKGRSNIFPMHYIDYVTKILDACGYSTKDGISVLIDKALVTDGGSCGLSMHDLLQDLGMHIVREECIRESGRRRMLGNHEDIYHVLEENAGTETIEVILLNISAIREVHVGPEAFAGMHNLKLLKFYEPEKHFPPKVHLSQGLKSLPNKLRLLHWERCPLKSLPSKFNPKKLVELCMHNSCLEKLWTGVQPLLENLTRIDLSYSKHIKEMPDLSRFPNLERINLSMTAIEEIPKFPTDSCNIKTLILCETAIEEIPPSIEFCSKLTELRLMNCRRLNNLPNNIFKLKSLESLTLSGCCRITMFPEISGKIQILSLDGTGIEEVPPSIENLSQLRDLDLKNCSKLKSLPTSIIKLKSLSYLSLKGCSKLENIPEALELVKELPEHLIWHDALNFFGRLDLSGCKSLVSLPNSLFEIFNSKSPIRNLILSSCSNLTELPENLGNLKRLETLEAYGAAIKQLPESLCGLSFLTSLCVSYCSNLTELPEKLGNLKLLKTLAADGAAIKQLPESLCGLSYLTSLSVSNCSNLTELPENLGNLTLLETLAADGAAIKQLPKSLCDLSSLKYLYVSNCSNLTELPKNLGNLKLLKTLAADESAIKQLLESLCGLSYLTSLCVSNCSNLTELPENLGNLKLRKTLAADGSAFKISRATCAGGVAIEEDEDDDCHYFTEEEEPQP